MAWIRSQSKELLLNAGFCYMQEPYGKSEPPAKIQLLAGTGAQTNDFVVGYFVTKEAALKELNSIRLWLDQGGRQVYQISSEDQ